jgi:glycosyltransferase involved in cell wall biosynthesis
MTGMGNGNEVSVANSLTVWLLQTGEPLHIDAGNPRPMRAMNLADSLTKAGHKVVLWSSAFYHQEKRHRSRVVQRINVSSQLEVRLIPSPGYERNIGPGRLWDHAMLARNLKRMLRHEYSLPDVAFVGYPPIETAAVMTSWLSARGVPSLLDLKDQWPSLFLDAMPVRLRAFGQLALWPYFHYGKVAMHQATGLSAMANSFLQWGLDFLGREKSQVDGVFPLTSPQVPLKDGDLREARLWWDKQGIFADGQMFRLAFVGSHMSVFDFMPVRDAAMSFAQQGAKVQFVICGDGGFSAQLRSMMANIPNVFFPGWVDRAQIETLAERSHAAMTPYRNIDSFNRSIPNKVIDALSLGLPILSPLQGEVADLISKHSVGLRYGTDSGKTLIECIEELRSDTKTIQKISENAVHLFERDFSFDKVYGGLVKHLEMLARSRKSQ